jgi:hypothetical protein
MNRGTLTKNKDGKWEVKWSDTESFGYGTHWMYTPISNDSDTSFFKEDMEVNFENIITGFDSENYSPIMFAKII